MKKNNASAIVKKPGILREAKFTFIHVNDGEIQGQHRGHSGLKLSSFMWMTLRCRLTLDRH